MKSTHLIALSSILALCACGSAEPEHVEFQAASTANLTSQFQPFLKTSVWNLMLPSPSTRSETPIPGGALQLGPLAPSDDPTWGIAIYMAQASDPVWTINCSNYNDARDLWPSNCQVQIHAPKTITAPNGGDGTVIIVDPNQQYAYEIWQFNVNGNYHAYAADVEVVDLRSSGIHRNVGITGSGLPGVGGLIKSYETKNALAIRHKLWMAANPGMLYQRSVWPAPTTDSWGNGGSAFLSEGDVVALSKKFNVDNNECGLSSFMKRIAHALQDYGGIIQDQSGDGLTIEAEIGSFQNYLGNEYWGDMWGELDCLKWHMVKVNNPWNGAQPGGLGF